ncbi:hypothetical protein K466DRAFT_605142 [Polyporus arcularius HHB13444]|uniref:Uncharacterized protein n=1 Tax=Polyporus arcularius HHB13444 TaxID=1314778 RepID=A0A5C3NTV8_9APHY|nr:hypothetical protein K466DRAFT_605142 [Polyporus arcularius HHB13444]
MCACDQLSDVHAVLESLSFCTHLEPATLVHPPFGNSMTCERWDRVYEQLAKEAIKFYLTALGHPDHESARALVGDEAFDRDSMDPLVCAPAAVVLLLQQRPVDNPRTIATETVR